MESWAGRSGIRPRCARSNRAGPRPDERGLHTPPAKTTRRGAIHELVGVAGPLPARSPLPPRQLPERKAVLCAWTSNTSSYSSTSRWTSGGKKRILPHPRKRSPTVALSQRGPDLGGAGQWPRWRKALKGSPTPHRPLGLWHPDGGPPPREWMIFVGAAFGIRRSLGRVSRPPDGPPRRRRASGTPGSVRQVFDQVPDVRLAGRH